MTVADKYKAGFDVADGQKLEIKKMTMTAEAAQLVVPVAKAREGFKNVIEVNKGTETERVDIPVGEGTVTVPVPAPNGNTAVKYTYQIKTQTTK